MLSAGRGTEAQRIFDEVMNHFPGSNAEVNHESNKNVVEYKVRITELKRSLRNSSAGDMEAQVLSRFEDISNLLATDPKLRTYDHRRSLVNSVNEVIGSLREA